MNKRKLNLKAFINSLLGTPMMRDLNDYLKECPVTQFFYESVYVTKDEDVAKLLAQLDLDLADQKLSQDLYEVIKGALTKDG